jgi:hypothetical protein
MKYCVPQFLFLILAVSCFAQVTQSYFGMTMTELEVQPSAPIGGIRLWNTGTDWAHMNPSAGVYDFSRLDQWLTEAKATGVDVLYTFGRTPLWASSNPNLNCGPNPTGECAPPKDLNLDGTGSDQIWKDFVTAIVAHSKQSQTARVAHYEVWNEPNATGNWQGTVAQVVRMTADAWAIIKSIDPHATVNSPAPTGEWKPDGKHTAAALWMLQFLSLGGGNFVDLFGIHTYVWQHNSIPVAEEVVPLVESVQAVIAAFSLSSLPLWSTEGSFGSSVDGEEGISDSDVQAAFTARHVMLQRSERLGRFYWFAWDSLPPEQWGTLWTWNQTNACSIPSSGGFLCKSGLAYQQITQWLIGATFTQKCSPINGTSLWNCQFSRPGNYAAEAIWDPSRTCSNGHCSVGQVSVPTQYLFYRDLDGNRQPIQNNVVPVGAKPILLENQ